MDVLKSLPPEVLLTIISHLRIPEFHHLQETARSYDTFFRNNENYVYRVAAIRHRFTEGSNVSLNSTLNDWELKRKRSMNGVDNWKTFCQRIYLLERTFEGQGPRPPTLKKSVITGTNVHRFKIDEENRIIICTHATGSLTVSSFNGDRIFSLDERYVPPFAHVEYSNGYAVFNGNMEHSLEVWKLDTRDNGSFDTVANDGGGDSNHSGILASLQHDDKFYPPHPSQLHAASPTSTKCYRNHSVKATHTNQLGFFSPYSLITLPFPCLPLAWRLSYPSLLIAPYATKSLYIFDIPSRRMIEEIDVSGHPWFKHPHHHQPVQDLADWEDGFDEGNDDEDNGQSDVEDDDDGMGIAEFDPSESCVKYVELSAQHAFVCTTYGLIIIPRLSYNHDYSRTNSEILKGSISLESDSADSRKVIHLPSYTLPRSLRIPSLSRRTAIKTVTVAPKGYLLLNDASPRFRLNAERILQTVPSYSDGVYKIMKRVLLVPPSPDMDVPKKPSTLGLLPNDATVLKGDGGPRPERARDRTLQMFSAVHVSPDGKDLAAITRRGLLYLVRGFERLHPSNAGSSDDSISGLTQSESQRFEDFVLRIDLGSPATCMAYDFGRVLVQTRRAIYIITWDTSHHDVLRPSVCSYAESAPSSEALSSVKHITIHALRPFSHLHILPLVKCVQLTRTRAWVTWAPSVLKRYQYDSNGKRSSKTIVRPWTGTIIQDEYDLGIGDSEHDETNSHQHTEERDGETSESESDEDDEDEQETRRNLYLPPPFGLSLDTHRTVCCMDFFPRPG